MARSYHDDGWTPVDDEPFREEYIGGRYVSDDEREDARRERYDDEHPPNLSCEECGFEWYSPIIRSRHEPPEPRYPDCPRCEGTA
jgi:hypothetical protein